MPPLPTADGHSYITPELLDQAQYGNNPNNFGFANGQQNFQQGYQQYYQNFQQINQPQQYPKIKTEETPNVNSHNFLGQPYQSQPSVYLDTLPSISQNLGQNMYQSNQFIQQQQQQQQHQQQQQQQLSPQQQYSPQYGNNQLSPQFTQSGFGQQRVSPQRVHPDGMIKQQQLSPQPMGSFPSLSTSPQNPGGNILYQKQSSFQPKQETDDVYRTVMGNEENSISEYARLIKTIRDIQKKSLEDGNAVDENMVNLRNEQLKLANSLNATSNVLKEMYRSVEMRSEDLTRWESMVLEVNLMQRQLNLYIQELLQYAGNAIPNALLCLVIIKQAFPIVLVQGHQLRDDELVVQLLTGACVNVKILSKVKASIMADGNKVSNSEDKLIDGDEQEMDPKTLVVKFPLHFPKGTRKSASCFRFTVLAQSTQKYPNSSNMTPFSTTLESEISLPYMVMTNQKQWEACEGVLLKKEAFGEHVEIPWPQFSNTLQRIFVRALARESREKTRPLSADDLHYLKNSRFFGGRHTINQTGFDAFWNWFGKCLQVIRYQRHVLKMWTAGYIAGFVNKAAIDQILINQKPGTFIIRFSETKPGTLATSRACVINGVNEVQNHLVSSKDNTTTIFLPDYCYEKSQLLYLVRFVITDHYQRGAIQLSLVEKNAALSEFSKQKKDGTPDGYAPL
eukprot:TRINITY_DN500_c0_g1_i1.p1 TRINITY_DN500_c0_g1~~TRINITY_DN500_c0_g1_i1.p1  ORF type:complete len:729 (+),score=230.74 TRINITY_DN500_c0_g1_i1:157-2187(+)